MTGASATLALTLRTAPNPAVTPALLDLLSQYEAHATFFQIGERVRAFPAISREVAQRGHTLGNHTDTHPRLTFLSSAPDPRRGGALRRRAGRCSGEATRWMRPPYGYRGPQLNSAVRSQNESARIVMWSRSAFDWRLPSSEKIIKRLRHVRGGDIVLLHDGIIQSRRAIVAIR